MHTKKGLAYVIKFTLLACQFFQASGCKIILKND